jgi:hypothetical protein
MLRDAQNAGKRPSASPSQRKTKRPRNSGNDRFQTQLEAKVAKMVCISLAPARLDRFPRGFTGHVAHPSRSIEIARVPACSPLPRLCLLCRFPQKPPLYRIATCSMSFIPSAPFSVFAGDPPAFTAESRSPQGRGYSRFFELSPETVALPVIPNTYPRANKAARSNRESIAAL